MKKPIFWNLMIALLIILPVSTVIGLAQENVNFPKTMAGERTAAYFNAFNSNDETVMRKYFVENVDPESLQRRPVEARIEVHKELWADMGKVEIKKIEVRKEFELNVTVKASKGGFYRFDFVYAEKPPHKLVLFGIDEAPGEEEKDQPATALTESEAIKEIDKYLSEMAAKDEFSGVGLIARNGQPVFRKAYGLASREFGVPNRADTKFNLGSINKIFTQIAVGQLEKKGKLSLDDTIGQHLSDYPNRAAAQKVTIKHLLTMTSGIGDFFGEKFEATPKDRIRRLKDYFQFFAAEPLLFEPGASRRYSNGGYVVLGAIIEKVSGTDYYSYVRQNIFLPNLMENTDHYFADAPTPNLAAGYYFDPESKTRRNNIYTRPMRGSSAGGGYSTADDLLKFSEALKSGKLDLVKTEPGQSDKFRGLGIAGGADGLNAFLEIMPDNGYTIIVLSNFDPPGAENAGKFIRKSLQRVK